MMASVSLFTTAKTANNTMDSNCEHGTWIWSLHATSNISKIIITNYYHSTLSAHKGIFRYSLYFVLRTESDARQGFIAKHENGNKTQSQNCLARRSSAVCDIELWVNRWKTRKVKKVRQLDLLCTRLTELASLWHTTTNPLWWEKCELLGGGRGGMFPSTRSC